MKIKKRFMCFTLALAMIVSVVSIPPTQVIASATALITDHNSAKLSAVKSIPSSWIDTTNKKLKIAYWHTSHGSQVTDGLSELKQVTSKKYSSLNIVEPDSTDLGNSNFDDVTRTYLKDHRSINVVMWSWCGQLSWMSSSDVSSYLKKMTALEKEFPKVKFVYMTGHLDGSGVKGTLNKNNEQIRDYCIEKGKILYDFADIESYDPDGNYYLDQYADDGCYYDSNGDGSVDSSNWAISWQNKHKEGVDWYNCSCAHSQALNGNQKAYAAWNLFARIAGWVQPETPVKTVTKPATVTISKAKKTSSKSLYVKWKKVSSARGYQIQCALNNKFTSGKKTVTVSKSKSSVTIKKLKNKKYYVRVRAYKVNGSKRVYGNWSKIKTCKK